MRTNEETLFLRCGYQAKIGGSNVESRQSLILYALEERPRPGSREVRVRAVPDGIMIRNKRREQHGQL